MDFAERAARNEELVHDVNEQIEEAAKLHGTDSAMPLHCECGKATCREQVDLRPSHYEGSSRTAVGSSSRQATSNRGWSACEEHEQFLIVEKIGEARAQIDKDHPQQQHRKNAERLTDDAEGSSERK